MSAWKPLALALLLATGALADGIKSVDGHDMSVTAAHGKPLLITFTDAKSKEEGTAFFRAQAARFTRVDGLVLHNIIVPGGVMLAPKGAIIARIRSDAAKLERDVRAALPADQRAAYDRATIRWHVDFDRHYSDQFKAPPHRVSLVLVDPDGKVAAREDKVDDAAIDRILAAARRFSHTP